MSKKIRVCVLPVAGREDPGQLLRMQGMRAGGRYEVLPGVPTRFFPGLRTFLKYKPDIFYFDWIGRYYHGRSLPVTLAKIFTFMLDVQLMTKVFRRPLVWSLHNLHSHEDSSTNRWEDRMQRYFARQATVIRVFSASSVARACAVLGVARAKVRVLPEGDFTGYYPNTMAPAEARARLGLAGGDFVLLWLGSIRPYKGIQELIEAFHQMAQPHWRLVIAGKPLIESYAREIAALAQGDARIQVHPHFIPEDELQVYYKAADAVALPFAEVENSGSVCLAMGFRKAVVAPDLGVIGERLHRQKELVYPPGGLADALRALAALPPSRLAEIGAANYAEITSYKWENMAGLFQNMASRRNEQ